MNKIFNYKYIALFAAMGLGVGSCTEDYNYDPAQAVSNMQVFFSNELPGEYELDLSKTSIDIVLNRVKTGEAVTIPLKVTSEEGSIFEIPATVSFDAESSTATIQVNYDPEKVVYGNYESVTITIGNEEVTTPYGLSSYTFTAGKTEWVSAGTGQYREALMDDLYGIGGYPVYDVEIEKSLVREGVYRMKNAYDGKYPYNESYDDGTKDWLDGDFYIEIDASDPEHVWVGRSVLGLNWGHGDVEIMSMVAYNLLAGRSDLETMKKESPELFGTLVDGIIEFPAGRNFLISYNDSWYYTNTSGMFAVALPGSVIKDYAVEFNYTGRFTDGAGNDYGVGSITFGEDVEQVRVAYVPFDTEDLDAVISAIENDEMEYAMADPSSASVMLPLETTGSYYAVVVVYAGGEVVDEYVFPFKFQSSHDGEVVLTWTPQFIGTYTYDAWWEGEDEGLTMSVCDQNEDMYRIEPFGSEDNPVSFTFYYDESGSIHVDEQETGEEFRDYGMVYFSDASAYDPEDFPESEFYNSYDPETGTFSFSLMYYVDAGYLLDEPAVETFELTGYASASSGKLRMLNDKGEVEKWKSKKVSVRRHKSRFAQKFMDNI